ncbi:TolC family protein [Clostridium beijerinckii]|uniref:TolC family protein n=1 Tax=Clostridium beijerinckii TaxID=1520 RepID=A0AAW3WCZ3_CLOBE|nr:TolC family protein [Clostridium beijerinckii]MBC2459097.1 TolC family protein [Clostridium beijerinckii]MBC2476608.1 TolC family protein [Clostridium beijerinckii]MDG5856598.1 TolC family protein [Clostridium beijerinckii]MZK54001.1 TolC family protein [Clostridium beijerinckii]MZK62093.1 TolC family protein [Clostridium beijerinckii]
MRKNINKIIAFAIGISVMSGSVVPAFAADSTQQTTTSTSTATNSQIVNGKPLLTLDEAIKGAISNSETLAIDDSKIGYINRTGDLNDDVDDAKDINDDVHDFNDDNQEIKLNQAKQQKDFDQDILEKKVVDKYNDIATKQMNIDKIAKELDIKKTQLANMKLKVSLGTDISTNLKSTELAVQDKQNTLTYSQNQLNDSIYSFKVLTGKDVTKYTLEDIKFESLKIDGSIDKYLDNVIDSFLKYSVQIVNLNKDYFDHDYEKDDDNKVSQDYVSSKQDNVDTAKTEVENAQEALDKAKADPTITDTTSYQKRLDDAKTSYGKAEDNYVLAIKSRMAYLGTKQGIVVDENTISADKKRLKDSLKGYYTDLLKQEAQIEYDKKNIEINNETLSNAKLKHDLGMMTDTDYNTIAVNNEAYDLQLRADIISYNTLKEEIQKPWLSLTKSAMQSQQQHLEG